MERRTCSGCADGVPVFLELIETEGSLLLLGIDWIWRMGSKGYVPSDRAVTNQRCTGDVVPCH